MGDYASNTLSVQINPLVGTEKEFFNEEKLIIGYENLFRLQKAGSNTEELTGDMRVEEGKILMKIDLNSPENSADSLS